MYCRDFIIENACIVTPSGTIKGGSIKVEDGIISEFKAGCIRPGGRRIDARGRYVLPGFVDLHSDAIEKEIEPRPNSYFPVDIAAYELDKRLASCGITTIFHALSFAEGEIGIRSNKKAAEVIRELNRIRDNMAIRTMVHARFEITDDGGILHLEALIKDGCVSLLSFMDHTPGQGQFKEVTAFKNYFGAVYKKSEGELMSIIDRKLAVRDSLEPHMEYMIRLCKSMNIPMASHDDDSEEKIHWLAQMDIGISEFPVNMEAAKAARSKGIYICLGAPNVLRGNSLAKNLSAREAISSKFGDILCSDYSPMAILHAVFTLERIGMLGLHEAINMASLNPSRAVGIADRTGSIETGKDADLIIVDVSGEVPKILKTFAAGKEVFSTC